MKTLATLLILFSAWQLSAQTAFRQAINMQEIRPVESEVVDAFQDAGLIYGEIAQQIKITQQFMETPFGTDIDYIDINIQSLRFLDTLIQENIDRKKMLKSESYDILRACQADLPEHYTQFLNDNTIVFTEALERCFENKMSVAMTPKEDDEEVIAMEAWASTRAFSVFNALERHEAPPTTATLTSPVNIAPVSFATSAVDATSQFLVERVREELLLVFFNEFFTKIDQSPELTALLPNTRVLLNKQDIFRVPSMGKVWTTAFQEDLNNFNANLSELILTHPNYADARHEIATQLFLVAGYSHEQFRKGIPSLQVFEGIQKRFGRERNEIGIAVALTGLLIDNLIVPRQNDLMEIDTFLQLRESGSKASLYFSGLLYQQNQILFESIKVDDKPLSAMIEQNHLKFNDKLIDLLHISAQMKSAREEFTHTDKKESPDAYRRAFYQYIDNFLHLVDFGFDIRYFVMPEELYESDYQQLYRPITHNAIRALQAEIEQDYASVILHTLQVIEPIALAPVRATEKKINQTQKDTKDYLQTIQNIQEGTGSGSNNIGQLQKAIKVSEQTLKDLQEEREKRYNRTKQVVSNLTYYGGFMVDVLSAEKTANIKAIIYKYAAPVGSYRVKRQSPFSISLNAYPGIQTGYEQVLNTNKYSFVTGITAPIGPSLNWGIDHHSLSLFLPVIDIGAAFSYRWQNEAQGFPADIKWEQILSPGAHLAWGVPKAPITILAGVQYTPKLRKITANGSDIQESALRFGLSATVDIPIFYFYRSKK